MPDIELRRQVRAIVYEALTDVELALQNKEYDRASASLREAMHRLMEVTNVPAQPEQ